MFYARPMESPFRELNEYEREAWAEGIVAVALT